jgi:hypothetical protein
LITTPPPFPPLPSLAPPEEGLSTFPCHVEITEYPEEAFEVLDMSMFDIVQVLQLRPFDRKYKALPKDLPLIKAVLAYSECQNR